MTSLQQMQELFFRCVRFDPAPRELEDVFAPSPRLSARDGMAVYRDMFWFRQVDALFDVFPRLAERLGKERFTRVCCRYLTAEPSRFPELERIGHALPRYLRESTDDLGGEREDLVDLAALELAALETLLAPHDGPSVRLESIDPTSFPRQKMTLTAAHALLSVGNNALSIFRGEPPCGNLSCRSVLFARPRFAVVHRVIDPDEAAAFERAREGLPVETVCLPFANPERAAVVLRRWFDDTLVLSLSEPT